MSCQPAENTEMRESNENIDFINIGVSFINTTAMQGQWERIFAFQLCRAPLIIAFNHHLGIWSALCQCFVVCQSFSPPFFPPFLTDAKIIRSWPFSPTPCCQHCFLSNYKLHSASALNQNVFITNFK